MIGRRTFVTALPAWITGSGIASAQFDNRLPQFRVDSPQVLIPFTAEDKQHHLVQGLTADDVRLLADGRETRIDFLNVEEGPASLLFIVDISRSMKKPVANLQEAIRRILRAAAADDEFGLIEFSNTAELTVDFTSMHSRLEERVAAIIPSGHTSLTDAIVLALREIRRGNYRRRAIIIVSDGGENHSRHVELEAFRAAVEADARIYAIELYPPLGEGFSGPTMLERLARATGGRYLPTAKRRQLPELIGRIDIHLSYLLGFTPPHDHRDDRLHRVDLKLRKTSATTGVRLYWKERYRVPSLL